MKQNILRLSLLVFLLAPLSTLQAQIQKGSLIKGKLISTTINPKETHRYKLKLQKDQFVFLRLLQKGVDVKVITYDADGEKMNQFDTPNGKNGAELFTITSSKKGTYAVEVSYLEEDKLSGNYDILVQKIKPRATSLNEEVDQIFSPWDNNETPGASVAIVKDGEIVYKKGYGLANLEYDIPIKPSTIFHIASVSKQFTVFSILLLEKQGKLSLDDEIQKYIPEVPDFGKKITLRHLASHTSGLRDQWNLLSMAGWRMDDVITKEHVLKLVSQQKELNFNPGDEFAYCNTGFTLLAEVVARVSEMSFADFTEVNIFKPLKMNNTLFYDDHEKIVKNRAYSYFYGNGGIKKSVLNYANVGATSLFTTVEDLSLWAMNFSKITVGDANIIDTMNTPATLNNGTKIGGALGQFVSKYKGLNEIQHGGADACFRSYLARYPDENFSVSVFSNSAEFNPGAMAHKVVDIYLKDKIKTTPKKEVAKEEKSSERINVDENILANYTGDYELQPGFIISVSLNSGQLSAKATGQTIVSLIPLSTTEFDVEGVGAKIEFIPNEGKSVESLKLHQGGQIMNAPRIENFDLSTVKLSDFSGEYYSEELATSYTFDLVNDTLIAKHSRLSDFKLNPVKKDVFSGEAWYFGQVEFVRDATNAIIGCKVTNGRVRNLFFKKIK